MSFKKIATLFLFSLTLFFYGIKNPLMNWDIIGYTAAVFYNNNMRGEELRKKTYQEIEALVTPDTYLDLTTSTPYRQTVADNADSIEQHMPFYTIRMAYIWATGITSSFFKISIPESTYWVSSFFASLCALMLGLMFYLPYLIWLILFPVTLYFSGFIEIASLSTPDSMSALLAVLTWLLYKKKSNWWALLPLTILPLARTDYILIAVILSYFSLSNKKFLQAALFLILPLAVYAFINKFNANYGYLKIFNFTLIRIDPFPATMNIEEGVMPYVSVYATNLKSFLGHKHFILFFLYGFFWFKKIRLLNRTIENQQVALVLGFVFLHFALFPAYYPRFFTWCAAFAGLQIIAWIYEFKNQLSNSKI